MCIRSINRRRRSRMSKRRISNLVTFRRSLSHHTSPMPNTFKLQMTVAVLVMGMLLAAADAMMFMMVATARSSALSLLRHCPQCYRSLCLCFNLMHHHNHHHHHHHPHHQLFLSCHLISLHLLLQSPPSALHGQLMSSAAAAEALQKLIMIPRCSNSQS
jgi:hypothetical protein